ncbi:unnamed protein product [Rotaria sp. Silwood1]|nr:unnamed protein product [Rotaria sp. Silwood1]CAF3641013.1 unnamed protein product [Rotaria sp. Silwood1]CAF3719264.1 unnamed protein product [Rotaria sp. Silwood1]CAF4645666.1 unnamed protein product [Rotaria sp. Silwood1]CAF4740465.1 unnamed protein product [Rotaria sp. Silwood1]
MFSDLIDDDLLTESLVLPSSTLIKPMVNINTSGNNNSSVLLMQPKLEPQSIVFDQQQQQQQPPSQTKMVPIAPRCDSNQTNTTNINTYTCSSCSQPIHERYFLHTHDRFSRGSYWHMQCLRCQCCDVLLADIASTFYTKDNILLCKSDYIKRYGSRPCSSCNKVIGTTEQVMRISPNHVYHINCFTCVKCHIPLVKGDRYVLFNGQPFCEKDNPLKSTTNINNTPTTKRGGTTSKRGAKAGRATAATVSTAAVQQTFVTPPQYHHTGHISLLNNPHTSSTITHSLLSNNNILNSNGFSSTTISNSDDLY